MVLELLIALLFVNTFLYGLSLFFVLRKKDDSVFTIRSPLLLLTNNFGGFLMTTTLIVYHIIDNLTDDVSQIGNFCDYIPDNYIIFHSLFFLSFVLRCDRLIRTCKVKSGNMEDLKDFQNSIHKYLETYYAKLLFLFVGLIVILSVSILVFAPMYTLTPYHLGKCHLDSGVDMSYITFVWIVIGFLENIILVTYCSLIFASDKLTSGVRAELLVFTIVWILFPNALRLFERDVGITDTDPLVTSLVSVIFLWFCLLLNAYLPWFYLIFSPPEVTYCIMPDHLNNLFIFLTEENCLYSFNDYLKEIKNETMKQKSLFSLKLYTTIMTYRYYFTIEEDYNLVLEYAKKISDKYFNNPSKELQSLVNAETIDSLMNQSLLMEKNEIYLEQYDSVVISCFNYLQQHFEIFQKSMDYEKLYNEIFIRTSIHDALITVGLINKY